MTSTVSRTAYALGAPCADQYHVQDGVVDASRPCRPARRVTLATDAASLVFDANKTAVLVIDMQNDFCAPGGWTHSLGVDMQTMSRPVPAINRVTRALRAQGMPVIWLNWGNRPDLLNVPAIVQLPFHQIGSGVGLSKPQGANLHAPQAEGSRVLEKSSWGAQVISELEVAASDIHVDKYRISGFWDSQLDSILRRLGVRTLLLAGVNADQCVMATLMDATFLGYDTVLVQDGVATSSPDYCLEATLYNVRSVFGFVSNSERIVRAFGEA